MIIFYENMYKNMSFINFTFLFNMDKFFKTKNHIQSVQSRWQDFLLLNVNSCIKESLFKGLLKPDVLWDLINFAVNKWC